jgi:hypothetical protein
MRELIDNPQYIVFIDDCIRWSAPVRRKGRSMLPTS